MAWHGLDWGIYFDKTNTLLPLPHQRAANDLTPAALDLTSQLLRLNPEFYTIWNYRREILLHTYLAPPSSSPDDTYHQTLTAHLHNELTFLLPLLKTHPKCYWLWNHRLWTLHQSTPLPNNPFWSAELTLATHLLRRDVRNFHGWMYRRLLVPQIAGASLTEQEFAYTTAMLQGAGGMSNYSAWHQRSGLIPRLLEERGAGEQERMDFLEDELELVRRYTSTNPWDSAVWFYHWWLVGSSAVGAGEGEAVVVRMERGVRLLMVGEEVEALKGLFEEQPGCRFVVKALVGCVGLLWRVRRQPRGEGEEENEEEEEEADEEKEKVEVKGWIEKLIELDPMRAGRYRDLEKELWALLV